MQGAEPFLAAIGAHEVEVMPAGGNLGPEVGRAAEGFAVKELVFDQPVDGFNLTLPGVTLGGPLLLLLRRSRSSSSLRRVLISLSFTTGGDNVPSPSQNG